MSVINRRNAVMGWLAWSGVKLLALQKARGAMPSVDRRTKKPNRSAIVLATLGAATVVVLTVKRTRGELEALDG